METYEEKYKDLVKRLNKAKEKKGVYTFNSVLDAIAPELKESEDDGIRRKLIAFLKQCKAVYGDNFTQFGLNIDDALAWLEKQGEKEEFIKKELECIRGYRDEAIRRLNELEQQGEQKHQYISRPKYIGEEELLGEQKPAEWSEEDEQLYNDLSDTYFYNDEDYPEETYKLMLKRVLDWMNKRAKFLRPQSQWKPSLAQLNALSIVSKRNAPDDIEAIVSLYNDLKKLK